jgi:predicted secreted protein
MNQIPDKPILLLSHCLLNQATRAEEVITAGATEKLLRLFSSYPIHLEQLPCPEFLFVGKRKKRTKDEWEKMAGFKKFCGELADQIKERVKRFDRKETFPLVTIARSPCCSSREVYIGKRILAGKGMLIEELEKRMKLEFLEFDFKSINESIKRLKGFLDNKRGRDYFSFQKK